MDELEIRGRIESVLAGQRVVTISVVDGMGSWAAPVYYAADGLELIFLSDPASRHSQAAETGQQVAASIFDDSGGWEKIRGLQMEGTVTRMPEAEQENARKIYVADFPFTAVFF